MDRIRKVILKDNYFAENGWLIYSKNGITAFNGKVGIKYGSQYMSNRVRELIAEHGRFGIPDAPRYLDIVGSLEKLTSVNIDADKGELTIRYLDGKGSVKVAVETDLPDSLPHDKIRWPTMQELEGTNALQIDSRVRELESLQTGEGEALFGDFMGIYSTGGRLFTFDYGVHVVSEQLEGLPELFIPRSILGLGFRDVEKVISRDDQLFVVGENVSYVSTQLAQLDMATHMATLASNFDAGTKHDVMFDTTSGVWRRAKKLAKAIVDMEIKNGEIVVSHESWREVLGKTHAPDIKFMVRISLLERWAAKSFGHQIAVAENGDHLLHGKTRSGLSFYGQLADVSKPITQTEAKQANDKAAEALVDEPQGTEGDEDDSAGFGL